MPTLTANAVMRARLVKVAPANPHLAARHGVHKSAPAPSNEVAKSDTVEPLDPAIAASRRARTEARNALMMRLRQLSPALFAPESYIPLPLAVGIRDQVVAQLGCDAIDAAVVLGIWCGKFRYQKALTQPGAVRRNLDGSDAGEVTAEQRAWAMQRLEKLKAKRRAKQATDA